MHWEFEVMLLPTSLPKVIRRGRRVWSALPVWVLQGVALILLMPSLFVLHYIVHTPVSWTYRSTAVCGETSSPSLVQHMCLFLRLSVTFQPSLSICLFLEVPHYVTVTDWSCRYMQVGVWSKCLPRGGWHLVSEVNRGYRKLVPSAVFWPGHTEKSCVFLLWPLNEWPGPQLQVSFIKARDRVCVIHQVWLKRVVACCGGT